MAAQSPFGAYGRLTPGDGSRGVNITYVRVPYWRVLRPRWVWLSVGAVFGFLFGLSVGVFL